MIRQSFFLFVLIILTCCRHQDPKLAQYLVQGEQLYEQHCSNCHQSDGKGFGLLYPPLADADYLKRNKDQVICIIKNGMQGPVTVNGKIYDQAMPANNQLTNLEIAEIVTYVYSRWGGEVRIVEVNQVSRVLRGCN